MSVKEAIEKARAELDRKWHEKYPNGMLYVFCSSFRGEDRIRMGRMLRRPTSGRYAHSEGSDTYVGASYFTTQWHYTTSDEAKFDKYLAKRGLTRKAFK